MTGAINRDGEWHDRNAIGVVPGHRHLIPRRHLPASLGRCRSAEDAGTAEGRLSLACSSTSRRRHLRTATTPRLSSFYAP